MSAMTDTPPANKRRDYRPLGLALAIAAAAAIGVLVELMPGRGVEAPPAAVPVASAGPLPGFDSLRQEAAQQPAESMQPTSTPQAQRAREIASLLRGAEKHIRERKYDEAIAAIDRAGVLDPRHPPTYLTMGHALAGKRDYAQARRYYEAAINFDPAYADAYFAHAAASEQLGDLESALGGMRSFLHVVKNPDPYRLPVAQARAAIWEWEAKLGRGEWGKTRGIPPGFTAQELRRDGKGVGTKMPVPNSVGPDGLSQYEIKTSDKFNIFKP